MKGLKSLLIIIVAFIAVFAGAMPGHAEPGVITTIAGNGTAGYSGDNGLATSARLWSPSGVAVDSAGNVYIADYLNNRIRKVGTDGVITTFAGDGTQAYSGDNGSATSASLNYPRGVAVDSVGNVYIADTDNGRIRKVATNGVITTFAGNGTQGYSGDSGPATSAMLANPNGVAVDSIGNIYIADQGNHRIRKIGTDGVITTVAGNGTQGYSGDGGPATSAMLANPNGVAVDSIGNIYIGDSANNRIRKVGTNGVITTFAGTGAAIYSGDGGQATAASLNNPYGVAVDSAGNVYIADYWNYRIRKVGTNGVITTVAGNGTGGFSGDGGPATSAQLNGPTGVAVDPIGNIYIANTTNHLIRKVEGNNVTLNISMGGSGFGTVYSDPAGIYCPADCTEPYPVGTVVILTATPDAGSTFTVWSGDADCGDGLVTIAVAITCTATFTAMPDLVVGSITAPSSAAAGSSQAISATITNSGSASAVFTYMRFYISTDANITTADTKLTATSLVVNGLGAGASQVINATVTIPSLAPGTWYIGAMADVTGKVAEINEANNTASTPVTIPGIDLIVSSVTAPTSAQAGTSAAISATIANSGNESAVFTYMRFYISPDANITTADTKLTTTSLVVSALAGGASQTLNATVTIPSLSPGTYYIGAIADVTGKVAEFSETNNTASIAMTVTNGTDLTVTGVTAPGSAQAGTSAAVTATITNVGTATSTWGYARLYISPDANITTADTKLTTSASVVNGLNAGASQIISATVTIPSLAPGTYYIGAIADVTNKVAEMNEGNNANSIAITVTSGVDLTVISVNAPASAATGSSQAISATINNGGTATSGWTYTRLYISPDANITTADTKLTTSASVVNGLASGASQTINATVTIPSLAPGTYYIGAIADVTNKVAEINEGNNANWTAITITP